MTRNPGPLTDIWSEWLLHHRHADDPEQADVVRREVARFVDRVLDDARLFPGMRLLDIGSGEGILAFRAIERMGPTIQVLLTDISVPMLRHAEEAAVQLQIARQCTFIECSAERLATIPDSSLDAVVTRASLAYVADKRAALGEFLRVLRPGGRLSLGEPILQDEAFAARALRRRLESAGSQPADEFMVLLHRWKSAQFPDDEATYASTPLVNFSERDLFYWTRDAGFSDIHLQLHIDWEPSIMTSWKTFLGTSPHPLAPTLGAVLEQRFSPEERRLFEARMRPRVEAGRSMTLNRIAYLNAVKP